MANIEADPSSQQIQNEKEQEGIVVWDQKGVVVLWPDGHCSRFSWATLRQTCQCSECQKRKKESAVDTDQLVQFYTLF
ncbi:MAG: gamma-butyrobetaine hydroxylase-like domain-containing protein [Candidatus Binatia bacterium]